MKSCKWGKGIMEQESSSAWEKGRQGREGRTGKGKHYRLFEKVIRNVLL